MSNPYDALLTNKKGELLYFFKTNAGMRVGVITKVVDGEEFGVTFALEGEDYEKVKALFH